MASPAAAPLDLPELNQIAAAHAWYLSRKITAMSNYARRWRTEYAKTLWTEPVSAAQRAGYTKPALAASILLVKYADVIVADRIRHFSSLEMIPEELKATLAEIARGNIAASPQQVKSLELIAKIAGMLTDKVDLQLPQGGLDAALKRALISPKQLPAPTSAPDVVDAELVGALPAPSPAE